MMNKKINFWCWGRDRFSLNDCFFEKASSGRTQSGWSRCWKLAIASSVFVGGTIASLGDCAKAQLNLTPDEAPERNLGTQVEALTPLVDQIQDGTQQGNNLFHSFSEFNVREGRSVYFENPAEVTNILSRVTGNDLSDILGTLGVGAPGALGTANLFLINPNGIIFGPNARLDVGGSFVATTANAIGFGNQGFFSASAPNTPTLLAVNPSAFLFNQIAAASIQNNSVAPAGLEPTRRVETFGLRVPDGRSLLLVGGDISMNGGRLNAFGGRVELGGVAGTGTVGLSVSDNEMRLLFPDGLARADISVVNTSRIDVAEKNGGSIVINARSLDISGRSRLVAGIASGLGTASSQAGDITLNATEEIKVRQSSGIGNNVFSNATGNSGDLIITTGSLFVTDGSQLQASTSGQGNAGNVIIDAHERIGLDGDTAVFSSVGQTGTGNGGDIHIATGTLSVTNGAQLIASTSGQGNAGSVIIDTRERIGLDGRSSDGTFGSDVFSRVEKTGRGQGGEIRITTGELSVTNGAQLVADTRGQGDAGSIIIDARERVSFDGNKTDVFSNVSQTGTGKGGEIRITTGELSVTNSAQLVSSTSGQGDAGSIIIDARERISFDRGYAFSSVEQTGTGNGGEIRITTGELSVTNGAQLSASTREQGDADSIIIDARERVSFDGNNTSTFSNVSQTGRGQGGDIRITTDKLELTNGGGLIASSSGQGDAGSIIIDARERVSFDGNNTSAFSSVSQTGTGKGGDIRITTDKLELTNGGGLIASSSGQGDAGDVEVSAGSIRFDLGGISSETASGDGGNITLSVQDILLLRRGSLISTTAGTALAAGDGGNITINTPFIVAVPSENSDITANAFSGSGGTVEVTAQGIFGLEPRSRQELQTLLGTDNPSELVPRRLPSNDITAISQTDPSLRGQVTLNTPDVDPSRGLVNLPAELVDVTGLIGQDCPGGGGTVGQSVSEFMITGRGGLPPKPTEPLRSDAVRVNLDTPTQSQENRASGAVTVNPTTSEPSPLVEAQGWVINDKGEVVLLAQASTVTPSSYPLTPATCHAS
jgi:filamentous hemagglutinin family protein